MKDLQKLYDVCLNELKAINIEPGEVSSVTKFKRKSKSAWGRCKYVRSQDRYEITINPLILADDVPEKETKTVIIHEILHACTKCEGHKGKWKQLAEKVSSKLGYDVTRTTSSERLNIVPEEKFNYKYTIKCTKCGATWNVSKRTKCVQNPKRYLCGQCRGSLTVEPFKKIIQTAELKEEQLTLF